MDIYEVLKNDHNQLKGLLNELADLKKSDDYRYILIEEIRNHLISHSRAEESILYNTLRAVNADKKLIFHSFQEHFQAESLLRTIQVMDKLNVEWKTIAKKLRDVVFHHIETEESEIFQEAQLAFTSDEASAMGEAFEKLKPKIEKEGFLMTSFDMMMNMLPPRFMEKMRKKNDNGDSRIEI